MEVAVITRHAIANYGSLLQAAATQNALETLGHNCRIIDDVRATYEIVGFSQSNPAEGKISDESPVGRALMGAKIGETVTVEAPIGNID